MRAPTRQSPGRFGGAAGPAGRLPCDARSAVPAAELASLTAFASLRQRRRDGRRGALKRAGLQTSAPRRSTGAPSRLPSRRRPRVATLARTVRHRSPETGLRLFCWPAQTRGGRRCALARLWDAEAHRACRPRAKRASSTCLPRVSERSERSERSEFGGRSVGPSTAGQSARRADRPTEAPARTASRPAQANILRCPLARNSPSSNVVKGITEEPAGNAPRPARVTTVRTAQAKVDRSEQAGAK